MQLKKETKEILGMAAFFSAILLYILPKVSAQSYYLGDTMQEAMWYFEDIFGPVFSALLGIDQFDAYFFAKILLLILVFIIVMFTLKKSEFLGRNNAAYFVVSLIVSILAIRFLPNELVAGAMLPYGVLGISVSVVIPFLVYFFFVHYSMSNGAGRKLAWIVFAVMFFGLWIKRRNEIGDFNWIYGVALVGVLIVIFADRAIHEYFGLFESSKIKREQNQLAIADLEARMTQLRAIPTPSRAVLDTIARLERRQRDLYRKV